MDPMNVFFSILFSMTGIAYFAHGKTHGMMFQFCGGALIIVPFFVGTTFWLVVICGVLCALPFFLHW